MPGARPARCKRRRPNEPRPQPLIRRSGSIRGICLNRVNLNDMKNRLFNSLLMLALCLSSFACEPRLEAKLLEGYPPTFHLDGNDFMRHFFICPELPEDQRNEKNALWQIAPDSSHNKSWPVDITYGTVPPGFTQMIPKNGERPPALEPGK